MTWGIYLLVFLVVLTGSTVQSSVGMGQGLVAAPLLRLLHPELLPGPLVFAGLMTSIVLMIRNTQSGDVRTVAPALAGRMIGTGIAVAMLAALSDRGLTVAIGVMVVLLVLSRVLGLSVNRTPRTLAGTGVVSGVSGTIAGLGGAPMGLLFQQDTAARSFRGPMGAYQAFGGAFSVFLLTVFGELDRESWLLALSLLPPLFLGWIAARWVTPIVDRGYLKPVIFALSTCSALVLIASELL